MAIELRPGTNDAVIYNSVITANEYRLPEHLGEHSVVIDIGAHAGLFSYFALERGAGAVYAFEPEPANFEQAQRNLEPFRSRVTLSRRAVWRSDIASTPLHFCPSGDAANAGGGTIIWETDGPLVEAIPFDEVVGSVCASSNTKRIDLLKIDCEGAEFPILLTSKRLGDIDRIVGEYHELRAEPPAHARVPGYSQFTVEALVDVLKRAGFQVRLESQAKGDFGTLGLFFAERRTLAGRLVSATRRLFG